MQDMTLQVLNDLLVSVDCSKCAILILVELRLAFNIVDDDILSNGTKDQVGITALKWFASNWTDGTFCSNTGKHQRLLYSCTLCALCLRCYADDEQTHLNWIQEISYPSHPSLISSKM